MFVLPWGAMMVMKGAIPAMSIKWALASIVLIASSLSASSQTLGIDSFIEAELPASVAPGLAYAQIESGEIVAQGFGERLQESGERVTSDTLFPIGSVTKSFTALAVMQLVEEGQVGLEDPVAMHLAAFAGGPSDEVTLRQLLNHTSGFSTVQGNKQHGNADASQLTLGDYVQQLALMEPAHAAGTIWEYSNANYQILGAVIEEKSGQSYADYIEQNIFQPLGMMDSEVVVGADPPGSVIGHRPWFGGVRPYSGGEEHLINAPAGGIVSSAEDMGRYLAMWLNGADDIVSASTKTMMVAPSGPASPLYGLGWSIDPELETAYHTGLVPGAEALASFSLAEGNGVVVLVNANGGLGFADTWYLIGGVGARAMGQAHEDDGSRTGPQVAYLSIALLPPLFLLLANVSWRGRTALRSKRQTSSGLLSLWIPLLMMAGLAWFLISLLPQFFGGSVATLQLYQPDFALCLIAGAILAPAWALFRLALAYIGSKKSIATG